MSRISSTWCSTPRPGTEPIWRSVMQELATAQGAEMVAIGLTDSQRYAGAVYGVVAGITLLAFSSNVARADCVLDYLARHPDRLVAAMIQDQEYRSCTGNPNPGRTRTVLEQISVQPVIRGAPARIAVATPRGPVPVAPPTP